MKRIVLFKKFLSALIIISIFSNFFSPTLNAVSTNWSANPWTLEKAKHLAERVLIWPNPKIINDLYIAWSSSSAVDLLFPTISWPDRTQYLSELNNFKWESFNISDTNANRKVYAFNYYADPYEAKRKLFWLFEDIFALDRTGWNSDNINFPDVDNHFKILYEESLWNYKKMIKRVLFDNQNPENSFAMWKYLDLLNQPNKDYPNENYARELMQLFLMLEYKPWEDAETQGALRNYTEEDVASLARILTWFRAWNDKIVYFDNEYHNTSTWIIFLSGDVKIWDSFSFYNSSSWTIDNTKIISPIWWNNWLWDNIIDYIFSKRESEIAYFLSWRLLKYYVVDKPTQSEIQLLANQLISNNFELFPTVKWLLSSDLMYSDKAMNSIRYKNPIELTIWTLKQLHYKNPNFVVDPILNDTSLLTNLDWTPYNPRSIFGRDGFDNNANFMNAYFHNAWVTYSSKIAFTTWSWYYDLADLIPLTTLVNSWIINVKTNTWNTYSWSINLSNITITLSQNVFQTWILQVQSLNLEQQENQEILPEISELENIINETTSSWENISSSGIIEETSTQVLNQEINKLPEIENWSWEIDENQIESNSWSIEELTSFKKSYEKIYSYILPKANADIVNQNTITFLTWMIVFPDFYIQTSSGKVYLDWSFNWNNWELIVSSWSFLYWTWSYGISNITLSVDSWYTLQRDITILEMITQLEDYLYNGRRLPEIVKNEMTNFLLKDQNGVSRTFLPNNTNYRNKYIRALISMMLVQPEFLIQSWYDLPTETPWLWNTPINNKNSKLIMVELYGWYDWLNWIIPKNNLSYYNEIRWNLAINTQDLIDLWDFYLNKTFESFKPFYDSGDLRIINKVWTPSHSRWHDTAAIQVASQKALQTVWTPWLIGELIKNETDPLNHIVLWTNKPPIYTNWNYINIGWGSILYKNNVWWTTTAEKNYQISTLKNILNSRNYPVLTWNNFKNSITLDTVWNSWQSSVWYTLSWRLNFTKNLINNNLWITYYVPGWGWYDTHWDQLKAWSYNLNDRTRELAQDIASFFTEMKAQNKDVTIIIYSEFWRTLKTNWTSWTDHGEWWWYFILSTNSNFKNSITQKIIWKINLEKEYNDWFGVWVDYRSIYSKILKNLYNIDVGSYFWKDYSLEDDLNTDVPNPVLKRNEYRNSYYNNVNLDLRFKFDDTNFRFKDWSYLKFYYWENENNLRQYSKWQMDNYTLMDDNSFKINLSLPRQRKYFYKLEVVDNQYDTYISSWSFTTPIKYETNSINNIIPLNSDSFFAKYNNTSVSWNRVIEKMVMYNNPVEEIVNSWSIIYSWSVKEINFTGGIVFTFWTWETFIDTLTNSWVWNWGFVLPNFINKNEFITKNATFSWSSLKNLPIENILQIWSDTLGVWMKLNQNVKISIPILSSSWTYKIITSEDWINWTEVNNITQNWNNLSFNTDHFSYYALYNTKNTITTPPVNPPPTGWWWSWGWSTWWSSWISSWWGWGWSIAKDYCPYWDNSSSYYDSKCDEKIKTLISDSKVIKDKKYVKNLKNQILADRIKSSKNKKETTKKTITSKYYIKEIPWYKLSLKIKAISLWISNNKKISSEDKQKYIQRFNEFLEAKYYLDKNSNDRTLKNKYNKQIILLKPVLKKLKKL